MISKPLGQLFSIVSVYLVLLCSVTAAEPSVIPMGDNTYSVTCQAEHAFQRDTDVLKAAAKDAALKYCAAQGKEMKIISFTSEKPFFSAGYCNAKIVFKALKAGDAELTTTAETVTVNGTQVTAGTGDMYSELIKLEDLRKKGILTDSEFQSEKKKILKRSR